MLYTLQHMKVQGGNFPFYVNQYALGNKLLKNSRKVKPDTIMTAFLFGLQLDMHVELFTCLSVSLSLALRDRISGYTCSPAPRPHRPPASGRRVSLHLFPMAYLRVPVI